MKYLIVIILLLPISCTVPCNSTIWKHVYEKDRLEIIKKCYTVVGTVVDISPVNGDMDSSFSIQVESPDSINNMLKRYPNNNGLLHIEIVCACNATSADPSSIAACKGYKNRIIMPLVGKKIKVTGSLVVDSPNEPNGHNILEIHPVSHITRLN